MKLYVGNCSLQTHLFNYKLPERTQNFTKEIKAGSQIVIEEGETEIQSIINQHVPYGLVDVNKIQGNFSGICYSTKEIDVSRIMHGREAHKEFLDERSQEIRDNSALAMNNELTKVAKNHGKEERDGFEMTIESQTLDPMQEDKTPLKQKIKVER